MSDLVDFLWVVLGILVLAYIVAGWELHAWLLGLREEGNL